MSSYVFITQYVLKKVKAKRWGSSNHSDEKTCRQKGCWVVLLSFVPVDVVGGPAESLWAWKCYRFDYTKEKGRSWVRDPCLACMLPWDFWKTATVCGSSTTGARLHGWMTHQDKTCMLKGSSLHLLISSGTCTSSCGVQLHRWAGHVEFHPSASRCFSHRKKLLKLRYSSIPLAAILDVRASDLQLGNQAETQG